MNNHVVRLDNLSMIRGNGANARLILKDINLKIREKEFVTIVGPTGCGKSTLLYLIFGSLSPTVGNVAVDGKRVAGIGPDCGIVFQKYELFPNLTVLENIAFGPILKDTTTPERLFHLPNFGRVRRKAEGEASELLQNIGLTAADGKKFPHELSGGMKQRVAIAQAMMTRPKILLMDEPFGALDESTRQEMQLLMLKAWQEYGLTVFFVTHDIEEAAFLGTRILGLSQHWQEIGGDPGVGSRIVLDKKPPGEHPKPTDYKYSPEFNELLKKIRHEVTEAKTRKSIVEFDLTHQDAWRSETTATVTATTTTQ